MAHTGTGGLSSSRPRVRQIYHTQQDASDIGYIVAMLVAFQTAHGGWWMVLCGVTRRSMEPTSSPYAMPDIPMNSVVWKRWLKRLDMPSDQVDLTGYWDDQYPGSI